MLRGVGQSFANAATYERSATDSGSACAETDIIEALSAPTADTEAVASRQECKDQVQVKASTVLADQQRDIVNDVHTVVGDQQEGNDQVGIEVSAAAANRQEGNDPVETEVSAVIANWQE